MILSRSPSRDGTPGCGHQWPTPPSTRPAIGRAPGRVYEAHSAPVGPASDSRAPYGLPILVRAGSGHVSAGQTSRTARQCARTPCQCAIRDSNPEPAD
jgi:hypothetical protein